MTARQAIRQRPNAGGPPVLALTHGQTVWLMTQLGLNHGASTGTFNYYIKSLRSLGVPFDKGKGQSEGHRHATYDLEEIMELTIALLLRVYGSLPDPIADGLRRFRQELRPIYRQAFVKGPRTDRCRVTASRHSMEIEGFFLDLNIRYSAGHLIEFGPPRTLSPFEAVAAYASAAMPARSYLPLDLSNVAMNIARLTQALPPRRARKAQRPALTGSHS